MRVNEESLKYTGVYNFYNNNNSNNNNIFPQDLHHIQMHN